MEMERDKVREKVGENEKESREGEMEREKAIGDEGRWREGRRVSKYGDEGG